MRRASVTKGLGSRKKRLAHAEFAQSFKINDPVQIIYGTFVLWVGWISFKCSGTLGSSSGREQLTARVGIVTCMGGASGAVAGMLNSYIWSGGQVRIADSSIGTLAGLVSITAACAHISIWEGALAGFIGGALACASVDWLEFFTIDDPVGAIPVHFVGGAWVLLVVGIFTNEDGYVPPSLAGLAHGGGWHLLGVQVLGILAIVGWGIGTTWLLLCTIRRTVGLRVSVEDEVRGLDASEHGPGKRVYASELVTSFLRRRRLQSEVSVRRAPRQPPCSNSEEYIESVAHATLALGTAKKAAMHFKKRVGAAHESSNQEAPAAPGAIEPTAEGESSGEHVIASIMRMPTSC